MSEINLVAVAFDDRNKAFLAFRGLGEADSAGRVDVRSAGVVERDAGGRLFVAEGGDREAGMHTAGGSLVGLLVGLVGGPAGVLFGWGTGALVGGLADLGRAEDTEDLVLEFSRVIPPGGNALVAEVDELGGSVIDEIATRMGGSVVRRPADAVLADMEAAQDAAAAAEDEAKRARREARKQERHEKYEERKARFKSSRRDDDHADDQATTNA